MSAKYCLLLGTALLLSACASDRTIQETADIASQFCLTNDDPHSEARTLLLSPSLARALTEARMRSGAYWFKDASANKAAVTTTTTTTMAADETSLQPPVQTSTTTITTKTPAAAPLPPKPVCKPGRMFTMNGVRYAEIHHGMEDGSADWTDRLVLKNINGQWMIDDVLFAPNYQNGMRETLVRVE